MNTYRFILEKYKGISTRYTCPQCGRKHTFTRYIDTENNNQYINDNVGKCNRLDKCGYHYTPKQYFADNPHERDKYLVEDGSLRPCGYHYTPREYFTDNPHKRDRGVSSFSFHREKEEKKIENLPPKPIGRLPRWFMEQTLGVECDYKGIVDRATYVQSSFPTNRTKKFAIVVRLENNYYLYLEL